MNEEIPVANENTTSQMPALEVLRKLGYKFIPQRSKDGLNADFNNETVRNGNLNEVVLKDILEKKLSEINSYEYQGKEYKFSSDTIGQAIKDLDVSLINGLISTNESIYDLLTLGKSYPQKLIDGSTRSFDIKYVDFENPERNDFYVTEEYSVMRVNGKETARPDIVLFINGIPVVVIECKDVDVSLKQGISQNIRNQKVEYIPNLMKYIQILVSASKNAVKYATVGTPEKFWMIWNEKDIEWQKEILDRVVVGRQVTKQDRDIVSLFEPNRLLEIIKDFVIFDAGDKKVPRYQQYFATKSIIRRIINDKEGGVVWHTQGSGKSITMVYVTKKIMQDKNVKNPQVLIVTDRIDLDKQIMKTFNKIGILAKRATTGSNLVELIKNKDIRVITSVVNKFETVVKDGTVVESPNTYILVDEGHRTEYGEMNRRMREVFKEAIYVSFTGTPIMKKDRNIFQKFGGLIDKYSLDDALHDNAIVPLIYEGKMVDQEVSKEQIDKKLDLITKKLSDEQRLEVMQKWSRFEKVASTEKRIGLVATDIAENYLKYWKDTGFNAMLATNKKVDAVRYYRFFEEYFPELKTAVVISSPDMREGEDDFTSETSDIVKSFYVKAIANYKNEEEYEEIIKSKFINGDIDILIVVDKLLTGFDAPKASVLYLDKQIKEHNLLQAIARVNRLYDGKDYGYIVDYRGLLGELDKAMTMYKDAGLEEFEDTDIQNSVYYIDSEITRLYQAYDELTNVFRGIQNKNDMEEYEIYLEDENIRKDFYNKLCIYGSVLGLILQSDRGYYKIGREKISEFRKALAFYQKLRATVKLRYSETIDHKEYETKMQKLLDDYVEATEIMKITEPVDISNSEDFEKELERIESKRGKADTIRTRLTKTISQKIKLNPAFYKKFSERIEETIRAYRERRIDDSKYLENMQAIKKDFNNGNSGIVYPSNITTENARAIYGIIFDSFEKNFKDDLNIEEIGEISLNIQREIESKVVRDLSTNESAINSMKQTIDDTLFFFLTDKGINITNFDMINTIINEIMEFVLANY